MLFGCKVQAVVQPGQAAGRAGMGEGRVICLRSFLDVNVPRNPA